MRGAHGSNGAKVIAPASLRTRARHLVGTQANKALRNIDLADSRANRAVLAEALARVQPESDRDELATSVLLTMHLGEATMRLAISVERAEGDALALATAYYKRMVLRELLSE